MQRWLVVFELLASSVRFCSSAMLLAAGGLQLSRAKHTDWRAFRKLRTTSSCCNTSRRTSPCYIAHSTFLHTRTSTSTASNHISKHNAQHIPLLALHCLGDYQVHVGNIPIASRHPRRHR